MTGTLEQSVAAIKKQLDDFFRVVQQSGNAISLNGSFSVANGINFPGRSNLLTNGGFEIWQRGNGPFATLGAYAADRWVVNPQGTSTMSVSKDTTHQDAGSTACAAITYTQGNTVSDSYQHLEEYQQFVGRTASLSMRVKTSTANAVRIYLTDSLTHAYSSYHSGSGNYETLTVTFTSASGGSYFSAGVELKASCTVYLDNAMLVFGTVAAPYAPLTVTDEWARCQRYYELLADGGDGTLAVSGDCSIIGETPRLSLLYAFKKAVTPTVTIVGTWAVNNCGQPSVVHSGTKGLRLIVTSTATGDVWALNTAAGNNISVEANP